MRVVGMTILHYGKEYLDAAIRSVINHVDAHYVFYTDQGSHGSRTDEPCPESRDELIAIAQNAAGEKLRWYEGRYDYEGQHRERIHQYEPDADVIVVVDADEIYADGMALEAIEFAQSANVRTIRLPFIHLWRSFRRGFAHDPAYPNRIICPKIGIGETTMPTDKRVWHFGYAQSEQITRYKWGGIHGHQGELRRDCNWIEDVFVANRQYDCHPVGSDAWNCEDIDLTHIPSVLLGHPYYNLEVIR